MVEENFRICLCKMSYIALILPFSPSLCCKKILAFVFVKLPWFGIKYAIHSFTMVEENFGICLCETSYIALILPFSPSLCCKKILEFVLVKLPWFGIKYAIHSFTMVKEDFRNRLCEMSEIALILPFTPSPWLKKILEFVFVKRLKLLWCYRLIHHSQRRFWNFVRVKRPRLASF